MAFKQYTKCTPTDKFSPLNQPLVIIGGIAGLLALITTIFLSALAVSIPGAAAAWFAGAISGYLAIVATFEYLLGGKLICLGGDRSAAGKIMSIEPADGKPFPENLDNDYSFNLLLDPHQDEDTIDETTLLFQDHLVIEQEASRSHGLPFKGYSGWEGRPILHCEIEGSRIHDVFTAFMAAWTVLIAAVLLAMALSTIPIIGWLLALIAALLGLGIGAGIVAGTWALADDGKVSDIDPTIGELHNGEHLYVFGTWTYDAGHNPEGDGWNEFHPVKHMQKVEGPLTEDEIKRLEIMVLDAISPETKKKQKLEGQRWELHPDLDGCEEDEEDVIIK